MHFYDKLLRFLAKKILCDYLSFSDTLSGLHPVYILSIFSNSGNFLKLQHCHCFIFVVPLPPVLFKGIL